MTVLRILLAAAASAPLSEPATRAEVTAQRAAVEQRFAREKLECEQRFAVSPCLEDLRKRRQDALAPLVRREQEFITEERQARAVAQAQRVKERQLAAAQDEVERRERSGAAAAPTQPRAPHAVKSRSPEQAERERRQAIGKADAEAATRRERALERQQRAQQRIAEHEARQKSRTKPPAAPLPLPGASAASAPK